MHDNRCEISDILQNSKPMASVIYDWFMLLHITKKAYQYYILTLLWSQDIHNLIIHWGNNLNKNEAKYLSIEGSKNVKYLLKSW